MKTRQFWLVGVTITVAAVAAACGSKKSDSGAGKTAISGIVKTDNGGGASSTPISGATVTGGGDSTTSAADGSWTLMVSSNSNVFVKATAASYVGSIHGLTVPAGGATDININLVPSSLVNAVATALGTTYDNTKGIVGVDFSGSASVGTGYGATLSAASTGSFVFDSSGTPVISSVTLSTNNNTLVFIGVTPGTTTVTAIPPGAHTCAAQEAGITNWQVDADTITEVHYNCN